MRPLFALLALVAIPAVLPAQRGEDDSGPVQVSELLHGRGEVRSFKAASLEGKEVSYWVYLPTPPKDGEHKDLPLVIWLHGMREDHLRFHERGGSGVLDRLIGKGDLPPCVLVSPNGDRSSFWIDGKESGRYESLVTKDLLEHIEKTLPVSKDPRRRAIAGVSMGGLGALNLALRSPDRFAAVSAHSAALFPPDPDNLDERFKRAYASWGSRMGLDAIFGRPIDTAIWKANNPMAMAGSGEAKRFQALSIRFDAGTEDRYQFHEPGLAFHKLLTQREIAHDWQSFEGAGHSWGSGSMPERLEAGFRFIAKAWKPKAKAESGSR